MKVFGYTVAGIGVLVLFWALGFAFTGLNLFSYTFWAPKQANAERKVFVNTNSYIQGKVDYLSRLRLAYKTADSPAQRLALKETILTEAANVDINKLPPDLQAFINALKEE